MAATAETVSRLVMSFIDEREGSARMLVRADFKEQFNAKRTEKGRVALAQRWLRMYTKGTR